MPTNISYTLTNPVDLTGSATGAAQTTAGASLLITESGTASATSSATGAIGEVVFTGADFKLESVTQLGLAIVRIRFTQDPLAANASGAHDALNPSQYKLTGPGQNYVTLVTPVASDPQSVDVTLFAALIGGSWQIAVSSDVQTASGRPLQQPQALTLEVTSSATPEPVSQGAKNDDAEAVLRKFLNPALKGKAWDALIAAFAVGDQYNWDNARAAFDQLFKSTASGMYLDRKNGDDGLKRPANIGISDELYRQLGIKVTNAKLTEQVILEILEVFYGSDSLRGHIDAGAFEPYVLNDGDTLVLNVDGVGLPTITFREGEFARIGQATALEVATSITRQLGMVGSTAFATVVKDPVSGAAGVRIYSGALGLISSVQVTGGLAQEALRFEQQVVAPPIGTDPATLTWNLTIPEAGSLAMKLEGVVALDMNQLQVGDYVLVTGDGFDPANRGSFPITAIDIEYVGSTYTQTLTLANDAAVAQTSVTQTSLNDVLFFRPVVKAIHAGGTRTVVVSQPDEGALDVVIPATTQAVNRSPGSGAYALDNDPLVGAQVTRNGTTATVTTSTPHGLAVGSQVTVDEVFASQGPTIHAGSSGVASASLGTLWAALDAPHTATSRTATKLQDGKVLLIGGSNPAQLFTISGSSVLADGAAQYSYGWADSGTPATARTLHTATLLNSGSVFVAGGAGPLASTEVWTAGAWAAGPNLATARQDHQAALLSSGKVLIFGGSDGTNALASSELYDGAAISAGPAMLAARTKFTSVVLSDGKVLAIGGTGLASCEVYDGTSWKATGSMAFTRESAAAALLPDGRVLVTGGTGRLATRQDAAAALATCEIYNPTTGRWSPAGKLKAAISGHTMAWIGSKLVVGSQYFDPTTGAFTTIPGAQSALEPLKVQVQTGLVLSIGQSAADLLVRANDALTAGGLNGVFRVASVPTPTSFTYSTPNVSAYSSSSATVRAMAAAPAPTGFKGPFVLDTQSDVAITGVETSSAQDLFKGRQYTSLKVADATAFPDEEGYLVIGYGTATVSYPVHYLGRISDTELLLDFQQKMPATNLAGATVTLLSGKAGLTSVDDPGSAGLFYATDSSAGRTAAQDQLKSVIATGIDLNLEVVYPGDQGLGKNSSDWVWSGEES